jgi:hypothetical protein
MGRPTRETYIAVLPFRASSMATRKCPVCGASVKEENLLRHVEDKHPRAKVEGLKEIRAASKKPARTASSKRVLAWKDDLARIGTVVSVAGVVWLVLAVLLPSPVGGAVPVSPTLVALVLVGVALVAAAWVLGSGVLARSWKKLGAVGLALGLALAGASALVATQEGAPTLSRSTTPEPGGWTKANNPVWKADGKPVFFYLGSTACPFCAASSWAVWEALKYFGSLPVPVFTTSMSNPNEPFRNVPEVDLSHVTLTGAYVTLDFREGDNNQAITLPSLSTLEEAYVVTYDSSSAIPFFVVGGMYYQSTLLDPSIFFPNGPSGIPMTPQAVDVAIASGTGPVYSAIHQQQLYVEAYLAMACHAAGIPPPAAVVNDFGVGSIIAQIQ